MTALQTAHDRLVKLNPDPQPGDVDKSGLTTLIISTKTPKQTDIQQKAGQHSMKLL